MLDALLPNMENNICLFGILFVFLVQINLYNNFKIVNNENKVFLIIFIKIL